MSILQERLVIGTTLASWKQAPGWLHLMEPEFFADGALREICRCIRLAQSRNGCCAPHHVAQVLMDEGQWQAVGGAMALANLADDSGTHVGIDHQIRSLQRMALVRKAHGLFSELASELARPAAWDEPESTVAQAVARCSALLTGDSTASGPRPASELLERVADKMRDRMDHDTPPSGVVTGIDHLDHLLGRLFGGDLILVAGRPSMGKTALALRFATRAARDGLTYVASLEMGEEGIASRLISAATVDPHVPIPYIRAHRPSEDKVASVFRAVGEVSPNLMIEAGKRMGVADIRASAMRLAVTQPLRLIVVDYIGKLQPHDRRLSRREWMASASAELKDLAMELDVPVVLLAQLNRECDSRNDKRPLLSDLRDCGDLEQDADVVIFVYRDEVYHPKEASEGEAELIVRKHRNGPIGTVMAHFDRPRAWFSNPPLGWER